MVKQLAGGIAVLSLLLPWVPARAVDAPPAVVINELMWMGSSASSADEWIELRNLSDAVVDLSGWQLTRKSSGVETLMLTVPVGKSIAPNGFFLIANNAPTALFGTAPNQMESPLSATPDVVDAAVSLLNSGLQIKLYSGSWNSGGIVVDAADDASGNPLAGAFDSGKNLFASMERNVAPGDGLIAASWHTATRAIGWDSGAIELGTPGNPNSATAPIARLSGPTEGVVGEPLTFDASESADPEGRALTFAWVFGDGSTAEGSTTTHPFSEVGTISVQVSVSNGEHTFIATSAVTISPAASVPAPEPPSQIGDVLLSEFQPAPSSDEFIEIVNHGSGPSSLKGWALSDGTHRFTLPSSPLAGGGLRSFSVGTTGIHLNDTGDTVSLYDPTGALRDAVHYTKTRSGWSLIRAVERWEWTNRPTPGETNASLTAMADVGVSEAPEAPTTRAGTVAGTTTSPQPAKNAVVQRAALSDIGEQEKGAVVRVQGAVSALPGSVAARTLYITDGSSGLAVYSAKVAYPTLSLGDRVEITGRVSHVQRGDRVLVSKTSDVRVVGLGTASPTVGTASSLGDAVGSLVKISGTIVDVTTSKITIDDGTGEIGVRRIKGLRPTVGATAVITGIVIGPESALQLLPRALEDVQLGVATSDTIDNPSLISAAHAAALGTQPSVAPPNSDRTGEALLWFGGALLIGVAAIALLKRFAPNLLNPRGHAGRKG